MTVEANILAGAFKWPAILLVTLIPLAVYVATLCPTVYGGDSGELIAACYTLGIAHIPGHPLYVLIGKLFSYLPIGDIAYRINLMSAVFAALALGSLFILQNLLFTPSPISSPPSRGRGEACLPAGRGEGELPSFEKTALLVLAVLAFGFSETFWHYATAAETYTGGIFFLAVLIVMLVRYDMTKNIRLLYGFSFVFGLSLGFILNHVLLIPAFLYWIFTAKSRLKTSQFIYCALLWLAGFSIYGFELIRMAEHPAIHFGNPDSLSRLIDNISGGIYRKAMVGQISIHKILNRLAFSAAWFFQEFRYGLIPFIALGAYQLARRNRRLFMFSLIAVSTIIAGTILAYSFDLSIDKKSYYLPIYLLCSLWMAAGFTLARAWAAGKNIPVYVFYGVLLAALCFEFGANYKRVDKRGNFLFYDMAKAAFETAEPNAVIFLDGEWLTFPMIYLRVVEGIRPDVTLYDRNNNVFESFYRFSTLDLETALDDRDIQEDEFISKAEHPVYFTKFRQLKRAGGAALAPEGLLYRAVKEGRKAKVEERFSEYQIRNLNEARLERDPASMRLLAHYYFLRGEGFLHDKNQAKGLEALRKGESLLVEMYAQYDVLAYIYYRYGRFEDAMRIFEKEIDLFPDYAPTYKNIGILYYEKLNDREKAKGYFKKYLEINPRASDRGLFLNLINGIAGVLG